MSLAWIAADAHLKRKTAKDGKAKPGDQGGKASDPTKSAVTRYIPTETVAFYLAATSVLQGLADKDTAHQFTLGLAVLTAFATPALLVAMIQGRNRKENGISIPLRELPWKRIGLAFISFVVWAGAMPQTLPDNEAVRMVFGVGVLAVSYFVPALQDWLEPDTASA